MAIKDKLTSAIETCPVVAIVRLDDLSNGVDLTRCLLDAGIRAIEFTLTNADAVDTIAQVRNQIEDGDHIIGAGSVLTIDDADRCIDNGAQFIVTPILDVDVLKHIKKRDCLATPGAYTPSEIYRATQNGADMVKVFPARTGGPAYLKDVLAPMPFLKLVPTGGVSLDNIGAFMNAGARAVGVGSNLVDPSLVASRNWSALQENARQYVEAARR